MGTKDDQMLFDDLWKYSQAHLDGNGLMDWAIASDGTGVAGKGAVPPTPTRTSRSRC